MPLSSAIFSSVSGLDSTSTAISVVGDNIANVNTPGFKERRAEFADVLGQTISSVGGFSTLGAGSKVSGVSTIFRQGTFETTARPTDVAIEGRGFFILDGSQGRYYSRAGMFTIDNQGFLVNPETLRVQGFAVDPLTGLPNGQLGDIQLATALSPPLPSSQLDISVNLDSNAQIMAGFDPTDPSGSSDFQTVVTLYDSLGNGHSSRLYFTKTGVNAWQWTAALNPADTTIAPGPGEQVVVQGSGTLTFDAAGVLQAATGSPVTFEFSGGAAAGQSVTFDFGPIAGVGTGDPTTQFATTSTTNSLTQDGFPAGSLQSISFESDGTLTGQFSNGETIPLAQLALANFPSVEGLSAVGNNNLVETRASGQPLVGGPGTGTLGSVRSGALEQSTVDLAGQFVRLILNQRAFQANTRTIATTNELLANLVALGQ